jgi:hypothetical protein
MDTYVFLFLGLTGFVILLADHYGLIDASDLAATLTDTELVAAAALASALVAALALLAVRPRRATGAGR